MATYEFINPSDPYTFEAPDLEVAAVVTFLVGGGRCGADSLDGSDNVPIFLFGGSEAWVQQTFGRDLKPWFEQTMGQRRSEICASLESFLYGGRQERQRLSAATLAERAEHNNRSRSSMNNIGRRAFDIASNLRAKEAA